MKYKEEEKGFQKTFEGYMDLIGNKYGDYENLSKKSSSGFSSKPFNNKDFMFFPIAILGSTEYDFRISFTCVGR